jgi:hypothetical protein
MRKRAVSLILMSAFVAAQPANAQQAQARANEELIEHFLSVLPDANALDAPPAADELEIERLVALNPGRADQIRPILLAYAECMAPTIRGTTFNLLRNAARSLGEAKLSRLIDFYEGSDYRTFSNLSDRNDRGERLTDAEFETMGRIMASYPLTELYQAMQASGTAMQQDQDFVTAATRCSMQKRAALIRVRLRFAP